MDRNAQGYVHAGVLATEWLKSAQRRMDAMKKKHDETETAAPDQPDKHPAIPELNETSVIGRLVGDPRLMETDTGHKRASFMLAVPYTFTNGKGEKVKKKNYVPIVAWRMIAQQCEALRKGYAVQVDGRIMTWSKDEKFHWEVEATLLDILDKTPEPSAPQPEAAVA